MQPARALRVVDEPTEAELAAAFALRVRVFVDEQGVAAEIESDGRDGDALHVVVFDALGAAVATGRMMLRGDKAKMQRIAVDTAQRGRGLGRVVMRRLEARAAAAGARVSTLSSQESAVPFYLRLGYVLRGEPFVEAGIWHRDMDLPLDEATAHADSSQR